MVVGFGGEEAHKAGCTVRGCREPPTMVARAGKQHAAAAWATEIKSCSMGGALGVPRREDGIANRSHRRGLPDIFARTRRRLGCGAVGAPPSNSGEPTPRFVFPSSCAMAELKVSVLHRSGDLWWEQMNVLPLHRFVNGLQGFDCPVLQLTRLSGWSSRAVSHVDVIYVTAISTDAQLP